MEIIVRTEYLKGKEFQINKLISIQIYSYFFAIILYISSNSSFRHTQWIRVLDTICFLSEFWCCYPHYISNAIPRWINHPFLKAIYINNNLWKHLKVIYEKEIHFHIAKMPEIFHFGNAWKYHLELHCCSADRNINTYIE